MGKACDNMITLTGIKKTYHGKLIFEDVDLVLKEGTITAFIGHNGCGKSTLLKVISGLAQKDCGEIKYEKPYRFSYVPEKFPAINMSARSYLKHMLAIEGISDTNVRNEMIIELAKDFFVETMIDKPMKHLSKGTLQKIGVMQALLSNPDVLLLDEPLSGQDVDSQEVFIQKILELKEKGKIILLSAHEPDLIYALGDKVFTIKENKLLKYEMKPKVQYKIMLSSSEIKQPEKEMEEEGSGYCLISDESRLSLDIRRLQKEGWHIGKVYEANENDAV